MNATTQDTMNKLPKSVRGKFLLSLWDSAKVFDIAIRTPKGLKYETQIPYLHFRKHPVEAGLYRVTDIWMHPNATDPNDPASYCYTLKRLRSKRRFSDLDETWKENRKNLPFREKDFSSQKVNYNCLDWDQLIRDGKVQSDVWKPGEQFNWEEFKKDLGQVLYKHKATLVVGREYDGPWDHEGSTTVDLMVNGEKKATLATDWRPYPVRRSEPTWEEGQPNR